jgi:hypothetical protein
MEVLAIQDGRRVAISIVPLLVEHHELDADQPCPAARRFENQRLRLFGIEFAIEDRPLDVVHTHRPDCGPLTHPVAGFHPAATAAAGVRRPRVTARTVSNSEGSPCTTAVPAPRLITARITASRLAAERPGDAGEMVVTVPHRMVLQHELTRHRCTVVQRRRNRAIELLIGEGTYRDRGGPAVGFEQRDRHLGRHLGLVERVPRVHRVHVRHGQAVDRLATRNPQREFDFERVHARDMMDDDAHRPAVAGKTRLPLAVAQAPDEGRKSVCAALESRRQRIGAWG